MSLLAKINRVLNVIAGIALAIMILVTIADVLAAHLHGRALKGVYEVVQASLVYMVFLGLPETFRNEDNICVDIVDQFLPHGGVDALRFVGAVLSAVYLLILEWSMIAPAWDAYRFGDYMSETGIPLWFVWIPILFGTALAVVASLLLLRPGRAAPQHSPELSP